MTHLTTHVLDAATGAPAVGVAVALTGPDGVVAHGETDAGGRLALGPDRLEPGEYTLEFATGAYFAARGVAAFHPRASIVFTVVDETHLHVPLLLSPFAYTTYRGS
jgi:5-hydroxyisourate hydrolase